MWSRWFLITGSLLSSLTLRDVNSFLISLSRLLSIVFECSLEWLRNFFVVVFFMLFTFDWCWGFLLSYFVNRERLREIEKEFFLHSMAYFYFYAVYVIIWWWFMMYGERDFWVPTNTYLLVRLLYLSGG